MRGDFPLPRQCRAEQERKAETGLSEHIFFDLRGPELPFLGLLPFRKRNRNKPKKEPGQIFAFCFPRRLLTRVSGFCDLFLGLFLRISLGIPDLALRRA